jgi:hypothetical protein
MDTSKDKSIGWWRNQAHKYFDKLWELGHLRRTEAYTWLEEMIGKKHIAQCCVEECKMIIEDSKTLSKDFIRLDKDFGIY